MDAATKVTTAVSKRIVIVLGQPERKSYGAALAQAYGEGARMSGAEVREIYLGELDFNPAPKASTAPEPGVRQAQETIRWAEHLVFVYPIWWGTVPVLL